LHQAHRLNTAYSTRTDLIVVTTAQFKELMELCWSPDASKRPNFKRVVEILQVRGRSLLVRAIAY